MVFFNNLGLGFTSRMKASDIASYASWGEENGISEMWTTESAGFRTGFPILVLVASRTKRMKLGLGATGVYSRHPAILAAEIATVDEFSDKRLKVGLGIDPAPRIDPDGSVKSLKPITAMEEVLEIIRGILKGSMRSYEGKIFQFNNPELSLQFEPVRREVPLYIGAKGPQMLRLAGRLADGVNMSLLSTPKYVRSAMERLKAGARRVGRNLDAFAVVAYLLFSVAKNRREARVTTKELLGIYLAHMTYGPVQREAGLSEQDVIPFKEAHDRGDHRSLTELVTEDLIERFAIAGTPEDCMEMIMEYLEAGVNTPVAFYPFGPDPYEAIKLIGKEVLPLVKKRVRR